MNIKIIMGRKIVWALILMAALAISSILVFQLHEKKIEFKTVVSSSMSPSINAGDVVAIEKVNASELKAGDVITFVFAGTYTTHRIINVSAGGFLTKGDANKDPDMDIVKRSEVAGKVVFTIPFFGYIGSFVRTPMGFAVLILIPGLLIIVSEALKLRKDWGGEKVPRFEHPHRHHASRINVLHQTRPIQNAKRAEKKIDASKYQTLQEELEESDGSRKEHQKP